MVYGSTTRVSTMGFTKVAIDEGLLGTLGTLWYVATTSCAVNGVPSWNFTFLRSLNSHVRSSSGFHDTASAGMSFPSGSRLMSGS